MPITITRGPNILPPDGDGPDHMMAGAGAVAAVVYGDSACTIELYDICPARFKVEGIIGIEDIPVVFGAFLTLAPNSRPGDTGRLPYES